MKINVCESRAAWGTEAAGGHERNPGCSLCKAAELQRQLSVFMQAGFYDDSTLGRCTIAT